MENKNIFGNTVLLAVAILTGTIACNIYRIRREGVVVELDEDDKPKPTGRKKEEGETKEPEKKPEEEPQPEPPQQPTQQEATGEGKSNVTRKKRYASKAEIEKANQKKREIRALIQSKTNILVKIPRKREYQEQARGLRNEIALLKAHLNLI